MSRIWSAIRSMLSHESVATFREIPATKVLKLHEPMLVNTLASPRWRTQAKGSCMSGLLASKHAIARRFPLWLATASGLAIALSSFGPLVSLSGGVLALPVLLCRTKEKQSTPDPVRPAARARGPQAKSPN